jgi:hypothetical protein
MPDDDFEATMRILDEVLSEKTKPCPVTWRTEDGRGTWRCGGEEGHEGEHQGMCTGNGAYVRRIGERISENLCVRDGAVAWKSSPNDQIQGWDDSIAILHELIAEVIKQEREMEESKQNVAERKYGVKRAKPRKSKPS